MTKKCAALLLCIILPFSFASCGTTGDEENQSNADGIQVSVTFNAMKEFVSAVGGDKVEITTIIPDGVEPHSFEPKAQDLASLESAEIFVYNGLGMESWVDDGINAVDNDNLIVVNASNDVTPITNTDQEEIKEHGQYDPHIWLSLKDAEIELNNIKDALVKADSNNKTYYEKNCSDYIAEIETLYNKYNKKFQNTQNKSFVTAHAAFSYLCKDFALEQNSVEDVFAEGEPSAKQLAELVNYCKANNVTTVFSEEMASADVSETLANEVGAKVETIYTIESNEDNKTYLERMEDNLKKIYESLQ